MSPIHRPRVGLLAGEAATVSDKVRKRYHKDSGKQNNEPALEQMSPASTRCPQHHHVVWMMTAMNISRNPSFLLNQLGVLTTFG